MSSLLYICVERSTNEGMRLVTPERILSFVPEYAPRVGLVGAAISDHPKLQELLAKLVKNGKGRGKLFACRQCAQTTHRKTTQKVDTKH